MRVDIHRLYDAGKIKIKHDGEIFLIESIRDAVSYTGLPKAVPIPDYIDVNNLMWRQQYLYSVRAFPEDRSLLTIKIRSYKVRNCLTNTLTSCLTNDLREQLNHCNN